MSKGRDKTCIQERNLKLLARFYFYSNLLSLKFERCVSNLEQEFNIKEATITSIVAQNSDTINNFASNKVTIAKLKASYPYLNWHYNHATRFQSASQLLLSLV